MKYGPMIWSGRHFVLEVSRNWQTLGGLAAKCIVGRRELTTLLSQVEGELIFELHQIVITSRNSFGNFDVWYEISRKICDDYGDMFILERPAHDNAFAQHSNNFEAVRNALKAANEGDTKSQAPDHYDSLSQPKKEAQNQNSRMIQLKEKIERAQAVLNDPSSTKAQRELALSAKGAFEQVYVEKE